MAGRFQCSLLEYCQPQHHQEQETLYLYCNLFHRSSSPSFYGSECSETSSAFQGRVYASVAFVCFIFYLCPEDNSSVFFNIASYNFTLVILHLFKNWSSLIGTYSAQRMNSDGSPQKRHCFFDLQNVRILQKVNFFISQKTLK
jgi:hypothetical protein